MTSGDPYLVQNWDHDHLGARLSLFVVADFVDRWVLRQHLTSTLNMTT